LLQKLTVGSQEKRELVELIEFLIAEGADVNAADDVFGETPFIMCAGGGETALCELLFGRGADPKYKQKDGVTALHMAAQNGHFKACRFLVDIADINAIVVDRRMHKETSLSMAAFNGHFEICEYLVKKGANVETGTQSLIYAAQVFLKF
jgi:ankyrin repeat protein